MQLTMGQFQAVTGANLPAMTQAQVLEAWLRRHSLECQRLLANAGLEHEEVSKIITELGRATDRREWRA